MPHTHQTTHLTHYILHMTHTLHTQQTAYLTHRTYIMHDYSYNLLITCESHHEPFINPSGSISNLSGTHQESSGTNQKPIRNYQELSGTIRNLQETSRTFRKHQKPSGSIRIHQESIRNPSGTISNPWGTRCCPNVGPPDLQGGSFNWLPLKNSIF